MFYGLNKFIKNLLPKRLFYRALLIVAVPVIVIQLIITIVFFDSLWIKTNKGMTRALVNEIKTYIEVISNDEYNKDEISSWNGAQNLLNQLGFQFKIEKNIIIFEQLPACLDENEARHCITDITKVLLEDDADKGELAHEIVVKVIKSTGQSVQFKTNEEIQNFIEVLFSHSDHSFCPNGKPIMQTITLEQLTSNF